MTKRFCDLCGKEIFKMESIERHVKRLCELLEREGDDGED